MKSGVQVAQESAALPVRNSASPAFDFTHMYDARPSSHPPVSAAAAALGALLRLPRSTTPLVSNLWLNQFRPAMFLCNEEGNMFQIEIFLISTTNIENSFAALC